MVILPPTGNKSNPYLIIIIWKHLYELHDILSVVSASLLCAAWIMHPSASLSLGGHRCIMQVWRGCEARFCSCCFQFHKRLSPKMWTEMCLLGLPAGGSGFPLRHPLRYHPPPPPHPLLLLLPCILWSSVLPPAHANKIPNIIHGYFDMRAFVCQLVMCAVEQKNLRNSMRPQT